jgi:hypothetical protein
MWALYCRARETEAHRKIKKFVSDHACIKLVREPVQGPWCPDSQPKGSGIHFIATAYVIARALCSEPHLLMCPPKRHCTVNAALPCPLWTESMSP